MRSFKVLKMNARMAWGKQYENQAREKVDVAVAAQVEETKSRIEFLEAMIKELEDQYRIEIRKKAILKNQCDQAYLRGVSAISMEALKMSHATLKDYYQGMRMPSYNGSNVAEQTAFVAETLKRQIREEKVITTQVKQTAGFD